MQKNLLFMLLFLSATVARAQTVASFDTLTLPRADTFYVNYSSYGQDVGFDDGLAHFPCVYDTSLGYEFWASGFAYSNMRDTLTPGFTNQYSAITGAGFDGSPQYAVAYGQTNKIFLKGKAVGQPVNGFYITNGTYPYLSMRDGDGFAKQFGGPTGSDPDWFRLMIKGYAGGQLTTDSVDFYLADFRFQDDSKDTILRGWQWVNLLPLGKVDSLLFTLQSSDTGSFGMNTPAYFCMDNFSTYETNSVGESPLRIAARVYPNPAVHTLFIEAKDANLKEITVLDGAGRIVKNLPVQGPVTQVDISQLTPGMYLLQLSGDGQTGMHRFIKQ